LPERVEFEAPQTPDPARKGRAAPVLKRSAQILSLLGLVALLRLLPVAQAMESAVAWVEQLGPLAPVAFILVYFVVTVLMLPGSVLSLAAGAIFGLFMGTALVATGATLGMAATFLLGRYLARPVVERRFANSPRFAAIDRAVGRGGWKIVALLRLSPAVPFNLQNYFYGLTAIRFWPCLTASALAILPGTFMFVYLGHVGRTSLSAIGGADSGRTPLQWALLVAGLAATVAVSVYVTKIALREMREQSALDETLGTPSVDADPSSTATGGTWLSALLHAALALVIIALVAALHFKPPWLLSLFGAPAVLYSLENLK